MISLPLPPSGAGISAYPEWDWTLPIRLEFNSYLGKYWSYQSIVVMYTGWKGAFAVTGIVRAEEQIYFARHGQKLWSMDFDFRSSGCQKTHFLQNSLFLVDAAEHQNFVRNGVLTFMWPKYHNPGVKPFGHDERNNLLRLGQVGLIASVAVHQG